MKSEIAFLRNEYLKSSLDEKDVSNDPFEQFGKWFDEAVKSELLEPNALILGTVDSSGQSHQRTVLLKGFDHDGFVFYTNYSSAKGNHMESNPKVSLIFPWFELQRQVIITGTVEKVASELSEEYFRSRPKGSQIGAFISNQSERLESRAVLEEKLKSAETEFENADVPRPETWGGYIVSPTFFEFWQGRANRLHDRIVYDQDNGAWKIGRLSP